MSIFSRKTKENKKEENTSAQATESPKEKKVVSQKAATRLIVRPLITEKATALEANGQYVFSVVKAANKSEVKKEIERLFNVKVDKVNIINKKKKRRLWRGREGFSGGLKKAIVTLKEGDKIEVLPN